KVPDGFVITAHACEIFFRYNALQIEINRRIKTIINDDLEQIYLCSQTIQQLIINSELPPELESAIKNQIKMLNPDKKNTITFALRSSALGEDSHDASFAGQYKSLLNVSVEHIFQAYKEIIASKYSLQAINYRLTRGFKDEDILMSVGCLTMIEALSGGVIYSHNPFQIHDDSIFIQSTWGLPKAIVDGSVNCDLFIISRSPKMHIKHKDINKKEAKFTCYPDEGVARKTIVDEFQLQPSIGDKNILHLAHLSEKIESHYGVPQDIEWALSNNESPMIYLLQTRPLKLKAMQEKQSRDLPQIDLRHRITKQGVMASPGRAFGQAYIADKEVDLLRFPNNAVLIVRQARPEWAPLLSQAVAVVSENGGFAGHLANVAREMGIPALFGVPDICQKIKAGIMVTVDAEGLSVYKSEIKSLLANVYTEKKTLADTPVYNALKKVSRHITPLNLIDPDSADFQAKNCQTLHDITRFIHEKSVTEMFTFGKSHGFDEVSSKQLHHGIPMKWWILNLDDGFKKEVKGKYVYLDDIASVPMMALWEGIVAVPWDGPPPVDKKGLMSVMFQATANPALNTGVRTKYSERNYFMISSKYCSLSSRLGFHFSTLESYVGERVSENYITFRFQGGAADHTRRLKRVQFIGDFLSDFGFKIKIRKDNLNARLKGYDKGYILDRLKIIGYLTIHTRQLDMVISNPAMITKYLNKFKNDIESVLDIKSAQNIELSEHKGH
ncbi:MAG: pyruvate, water dikinase, partial [Desulfobacteraceae bacterium]|nr:pyruvate, water dikinase [Desulfobacteraceae bacterium]